MTIIKNLILWLVVVFLMIVAILQYRAAWADGCPDGGFHGNMYIVAPDGDETVVSGILTYVMTTRYTDTFIIGGVTYIVPFDAVLNISISNELPCTYYIVIDGDPIFHDGFEGN